ncbi:glycoside hydrolase family 16 protein [Pontiellaceae bacterium B1224]|nr:glycoside hydrolase family 16 protein [Pontiellaceae bacterium B1224]
MIYNKATALGLAVILSAGISAHSAVIWSDEFDDTVINKDNWTYDVGGHGFGNGQMEYNTARSENSYIDNGSLVIKAIRESYSGNEFTSARMITQGRFAFKYGSLEARIKMPDTENGLWPAFWLLGNNFPGVEWPHCGEMDIVEMGSEAGIAEGKQQERFNCALHFSNAAEEKQSNVAWEDAPVDLSLDYHLYKVSWTPTDITFYLDGAVVATWDITADYMAEFHQPHFMILNLAIGGWPDTYTGVTDPAGVTALPGAGSSAIMQIDWVRLSDNPYTELYLGEDAEESGNFGIFTETTPVDSSLVFGDDTATNWPYSDEAALYLWADTMTVSDTPATPSEGTECVTFNVQSVGWLGMGVFMPNFRNMENYSDGTLHFDIQTTSSDILKVGVQSSRAGQFWLPMGDETTEFGFARDGDWHSISVPLNRFANTDFKTIQQMFMLLADSATPGTAISLDNIWWEPSVVRARPSAGSFGVYTETGTNKSAGEFGLGVDGDFFVWADTLDPAVQDPYEGSESLSFTSAPGLSWFGAAFTPNVKYDLSAFDNPNGTLNFAMKTSSSVPFQVGMKSGNMDGVGQKWISFEAGSDPYGFVRDGNWHMIQIPTSNFVADVDLSQMSQLFQILGTEEAISDIELDDIYYAGGRAFKTNVVSALIQDGVGISWPSTDGSSYTVQWAEAINTNTVWNSVSPAVEGDWTTKTVFDPTIDPSRFYQVVELP